METLKIKIRGRVQGVFFRANTKKFCEAHGLNGYAENLSAGAVQIIVAGTEENLKKLIAWLNSSPGISQVKKIEVRRIKEKKYSCFEIKRKDNFFIDKKKSIGNLLKAR